MLKVSQFIFNFIHKNFKLITNLLNTNKFNLQQRVCKKKKNYRSKFSKQIYFANLFAIYTKKTINSALNT